MSDEVQAELDTIREFQEEREMTPEQAKSLREALRREAVYFIPYCPCPPSMFNVTHVNSHVGRSDV